MFALRRSDSSSSKSTKKVDKSIRKPSLTESAIRAVAKEEEWEDLDGKSETRSRISTRPEKHTSNRSGRSRSRSRDRKKGSSDKRDEQKRKEKHTDSDRITRSEAVGGDTSAGYVPGPKNQFSGQSEPYGVPPSSSRPLPVHASSQFPGQFPVDYSHNAFAQSGLTLSEGGHGLASDYYGDQGQSVATQPGVRPPTPELKLHHPSNLQPASATPNPVADTGIGAAAEFYGASSTPSSFAQPNSSSRPPNGSSEIYYASPQASHPAPKPSSSLPAAIGVAGLAAGGYAAHAIGAGSSPALHHNPPQKDQFTYRPPSQSGQMAAQSHHHKHRGPLDRLFDLVQNKEDVRRMEEYTEYIGVCKYCFDPNSSARDAPRPHHYHRRRSSDSFRRRRSEESLRRAPRRKGKRPGIDKDARYASSTSSSSDEGAKRTSKTGWLGAGLAGYGIAKVGEALWNQKHDLSDGVSAKPGRSERPPTYRSTASDTSRGIVRPVDHHEDPSQPWNPDALMVWHPEPRQISRSRSRERKEVLIGPGRPSDGQTAGAFARQRSRTRSRSHSPELGEVLGFSRPRSARKSPKGRKKDKQRGFFNFGNASTSSSDSGATFGSTVSRRRKSPRRRSRRNSRDDLNTTLLGIGATAAALAAAQNYRRPGLVAARHKPGKRKECGQGVILDEEGSADEEGWESVSESASDSSSASSALAFGDNDIDRGTDSARRSASNSQSWGMSKWGWRWGASSQKPVKERPVQSKATGPAAAASTRLTLYSSTPQAGVASTTSSYPQASPATVEPLRHVDPMPLEDFTASRRDRDGPPSRAQRERSSTQHDDRYPEQSMSRSPQVSGSRDHTLRDTALIGGAAITAAGIYAASRGRKDDPNVRFEDESYHRRDQQAERGRENRDDYRVARSERERAQESDRTREKREQAERKAYDRARENERQANADRQAHEAQYHMSGAVPSNPIGVPVVPVVPISEGLSERERHLEELIAARKKELAEQALRNTATSRSSSADHDGSGAPTAAERPGYDATAGYYTQTFSPSRRDTGDQTYFREMPDNNSRDTAERVVADLKEKYSYPQPTQAEVFAPKHLVEEPLPAEEELRQKKIKEWVPNADADIHYTMHATDYKRFDPKTDVLPRKNGVPHLGLIEPTPPVSMAGSAKGGPSPVLSYQSDSEKPSHKQTPERSAEERSATRVSWGPDDTRVYEVESPVPTPRVQPDGFDDTDPVIEVVSTDKGIPSASYKFSDLPSAAAPFLVDNVSAEPEVIEIVREEPGLATGHTGMYRSPFFESVSDLGYSTYVPGNEVVPPVQGFVEGEVDEPTPPVTTRTSYMPGAFEDDASPVMAGDNKPQGRDSMRDPTDEGERGLDSKSAPVETSLPATGGDDFEVPLTKKEKQRKEKLARQNIDEPAPSVKAEATDVDLPILTRKEQKKRDKLGRSNTEEFEDAIETPSQLESGPAFATTVDEEWQAPLSRKEQKKRDKLARQLTDETNSPVEDVADDKPAHGQWDVPLSRKEQKKRDKLSRQNTDEFTEAPATPLQVATETVAPVADDEWSVPLSRKEQKKRDKLARQLTDDSIAPEQVVVNEEPEHDEWSVPLSRKEQKKREKLARRVSGEKSGIVTGFDATTPSTKAEQIEPTWEAPLSKKEQKKLEKDRRKSLTGDRSYQHNDTFQDDRKASKQDDRAESSGTHNSQSQPSDRDSGKKSFGDIATALLAGAATGFAAKSAIKSKTKDEASGRSSDKKSSRSSSEKASATKDVEHRAFSHSVPSSFEEPERVETKEERRARKKKARRSGDFEDKADRIPNYSTSSAAYDDEKRDKSNYSTSSAAYDDDQRDKANDRRRDTGGDDDNRSTASGLSRRSTADHDNTISDIKGESRKSPDQDEQDQSFLAERVEVEELRSLPATTSLQPSQAPEMVHSAGSLDNMDAHDTSREVTSREGAILSESPASYAHLVESGRGASATPSRPASATAVPFRFRRPPASPIATSGFPPIAARRAGSFSTKAPASPDPPVSLVSPRTKLARPRSIEIRREFQPLYLVEHNRKPVAIVHEDEPLPPLPLSRETSRTSSIRGSGSDGYESALEEQLFEYAVETPLPAASVKDELDYLVSPLERTTFSVEDVLSSNQSTPRASTFPTDIHEKKPKKGPEYYSWDDMLREERERELRADRDLVVEDVPQPQSDPAISTGLGLTDLAGLAALGTGVALVAGPSAVATDFVEDQDQASRSVMLDALPTDPATSVADPTQSEPEQNSSFTNPLEQPEAEFYVKLARKGSQKKVKALKLGTAVITDAEATRETAEEVRNRAERDTQDAIDGLFGHTENPGKEWRERRQSRGHRPRGASMDMKAARSSAILLNDATASRDDSVFLSETPRAVEEPVQNEVLADPKPETVTAQESTSEPRAPAAQDGWLLKRTKLDKKKKGKKGKDVKFDIWNDEPPAPEQTVQVEDDQRPATANVEPEAQTPVDEPSTTPAAEQIAQSEINSGQEPSPQEATRSLSSRELKKLKKEKKKKLGASAIEPSSSGGLPQEQFEATASQAATTTPDFDGLERGESDDILENRTTRDSDRVLEESNSVPESTLNNQEEARESIYASTKPLSKKELKKLKKGKKVDLWSEEPSPAVEEPVRTAHEPIADFTQSNPALQPSTDFTNNDADETMERGLEPSVWEKPLSKKELKKLKKGKHVDLWSEAPSAVATAGGSKLDAESTHLAGHVDVQAQEAEAPAWDRSLSKKELKKLKKGKKVDLWGEEPFPAADHTLEATPAGSFEQIRFDALIQPVSDSTVADNPPDYDFPSDSEPDRATIPQPESTTSGYVLSKKERKKLEKGKKLDLWSDVPVLSPESNERLDNAKDQLPEAVESTLIDADESPADTKTQDDSLDVATEVWAKPLSRKELKKLKKSGRSAARVNEEEVKPSVVPVTGDEERDQSSARTSAPSSSSGYWGVLAGAVTGAGATVAALATGDRESDKHETTDVPQSSKDADGNAQSVSLDTVEKADRSAISTGLSPGLADDTEDIHDDFNESSSKGGEVTAKDEKRKSATSAVLSWVLPNDRQDGATTRQAQDAIKVDSQPAGSNLGTGEPLWGPDDLARDESDRFANPGTDVPVQQDTHTMPEPPAQQTSHDTPRDDVNSVSADAPVFEPAVPRDHSNLWDADDVIRDESSRMRGDVEGEGHPRSGSVVDASGSGNTATYTVDAYKLDETSEAIEPPVNAEDAWTAPTKKRKGKKGKRAAAAAELDLASTTITDNDSTQYMPSEESSATLTRDSPVVESTIAVNALMDTDAVGLPSVQPDEALPIDTSAQDNGLDSANQPLKTAAEDEWGYFTTKKQKKGQKGKRSSAVTTPLELSVVKEKSGGAIGTIGPRNASDRSGLDESEPSTSEGKDIGVKAAATAIAATVASTMASRDSTTKGSGSPTEHQSDKFDADASHRDDASITTREAEAIMATTLSTRDNADSESMDVSLDRMIMPDDPRDLPFRFGRRIDDDVGLSPASSEGALETMKMPEDLRDLPAQTDLVNIEQISQPPAVATALGDWDIDPLLDSNVETPDEMWARMTKKKKGRKSKLSSAIGTPRSNDSHLAPPPSIATPKTVPGPSKETGNRSGLVMEKATMDQPSATVEPLAIPRPPAKLGDDIMLTESPVEEVGISRFKDSPPRDFDQDVGRQPSSHVSSEGQVMGVLRLPLTRAPTELIEDERQPLLSRRESMERDVSPLTKLSDADIAEDKDTIGPSNNPADIVAKDGSVGQQIEENNFESFSFKPSKKDKKKAKKQKRQTLDLAEPDDSTITGPIAVQNDSQTPLPIQAQHDGSADPEEDRTVASKTRTNAPDEFRLSRPLSKFDWADEVEAADQIDDMMLVPATDDDLRPTPDGSAALAATSQPSADPKLEAPVGRKLSKKEKRKAKGKSSVFDEPEPKPITDTPDSPHRDIDFAATLAAGLAQSGFNSDMVVDDPAFHRRSSPSAHAAEADPEESLAVVTKKGKKDKKARKSAADAFAEETDAHRTGAEELDLRDTFGGHRQTSPPQAADHDDFNAALAAGLGAAGFAVAMLSRSQDLTSVAEAEEPTFTQSGKKKRKDVDDEGFGLEDDVARRAIELSGDLPDVHVAEVEVEEDEWALPSKKSKKGKAKGKTAKINAADTGREPAAQSIDESALPATSSKKQKKKNKRGSAFDWSAETQAKDVPEKTTDDVVPSPIVSRAGLMHTSEVSQHLPTTIGDNATSGGRSLTPLGSPSWSFENLDKNRDSGLPESPNISGEVENRTSTRDSGYDTITDRSNRSSSQRYDIPETIIETGVSDLNADRESVASWEEWDIPNKRTRSTGTALTGQSAEERGPPPVDSTTKNRTSYLFSTPTETKIDSSPRQSFRQRMESGSRQPSGLGLGLGDPQNSQQTPSQTRLESLRSPTGISNASASNLQRLKSPDTDRVPSIAASIISNESATPSLRRTDRSASGDLRLSARRGEASNLVPLAIAAHQTNNSITHPRAPPTPPLNGDERLVNRSDRAMSDHYEGYGDGEPMTTSPTRPQSVRRKQSMYIVDMESRVEALVAENRRLQASRGGLDVDGDESPVRHAFANSEMQLREKDAEISQIKAMLDSITQELEQLKELNATLTEKNQNLIADTNDRYGTLQDEHSYANTQWQQSLRELEKLRHEHSQLSNGMESIVRQHIDAALEDKDTEIARLRNELDFATSEIRTLQARIQATTAENHLTVRDEDYFDGACQTLCQHVQAWVLRFSKSSDNRACRLSSDIKDEKLEGRLDNTMLDGSDVDLLLVDRIRRRDVFMSLVMTLVWEYIFTRYLFGMDREQRQKLKTLEKVLLEVGPPRAVAQWRAITLTLLSQRPAFSTQKNLDHEAVTQEIYSALASLLPPPKTAESQLIASLKKVVRMAIDLSIDMRTQRADYFMLPPPVPEYDGNGDLTRTTRFDATTMNERSGEYASNEELESTGSVVKVVLFPLVMKKGDESGEGGEETVICPAQVLVATSKHGKRVVRRRSGVMDIDDGGSRGTGARSRMSFASGGGETYI